MSTSKSVEANAETQDTLAQGLDRSTAALPVEENINNNDDAAGTVVSQHQTHRSTSSGSEPVRNRAMRADTTTAIQHSQQAESVPPLPVPTLESLSHTTPLDRTQSSAIGAPIESLPAVPDNADTGPILMLTLLLLTGARHPFHLDAKYLAKRNVQVQGNDPFNLSVYKVKELILREWREEWESKPSSPSAIRLISFGKVLDDKSAIKDLKFQPKASNVVHISIKPQDFIEDEDAKGAKSGRPQSRDGNEGRSPGCRCVIM